MTKSTGDCIEKASLNGLKASSARSKGMEDEFLLDRRERRTYRYRRTFVPQLTQSRRYTTHGTTTGYIITICYWTLLLLADKHPSKDPNTLRIPSQLFMGVPSFTSEPYPIVNKVHIYI